jgi:hypothetical protein
MPKRCGEMPKDSRMDYRAPDQDQLDLFFTDQSLSLHKSGHNVERQKKEEEKLYIHQRLPVCCVRPTLAYFF